MKQDIVKQRDRLIKDLYKKGYSVEDIKKVFNLTKGGVYFIIKKP